MTAGKAQQKITALFSPNDLKWQLQGLQKQCSLVPKAKSIPEINININTFA
jgi:hypothetical protein